MAWREKSLHAPFRNYIQRLSSVDRCAPTRKKNYPLTRLQTHRTLSLSLSLTDSKVCSRRCKKNPLFPFTLERNWQEKEEKKKKKPSKALMAARPSGNRRALGDIGNIVGALSATYLVTKPQQQQKFDTELTLKNHVNNRLAEDDSKNGRKVSSSSEKRNRIPDTDGNGRMPVDGMEEEEKQEKENVRKKKLERRECATEIDASMSSMSTETTQPCPDGKGNLHV